ncbi:MAG: hypothetical protein OXI34_11830 [Chloroflexota bacterium]|nr:hypothetical protein [Chloroflexota bacterium]MDE2854682.1 hypothetical protein [Chloroflexota bacterium]MDE2946036.1 hypothetical protein [Chloroflexota bacterium]
MTAQDTKLTYQQLSVLELLKAHIQSQKDAITVLENKAQQNFTIINIIAAIVAALNLELGEADKIRQVINERPLFALILIGYATVVILSIWAVMLRKLASHPMKISLQNAQDWSNCDLDHHFDILTKSYVEIHEHNEQIVRQKGRLVQWAHILIVAVIILIFLEASGL